LEGSVVDDGTVSREGVETGGIGVAVVVAIVNTSSTVTIVNGHYFGLNKEK
jgi:hypothetical protein